MDDKGIELPKNENLEHWLLLQPDSLFPEYDTARGELPYPKRYESLKTILQPYHGKVEMGAMASSIETWRKELTEQVKESGNDGSSSLIEKILENDPIIYLNNHGNEHVKKVIEKASEILHYFSNGYLTPYEVFFLLCSIQIHDIGNIYGRNNHERKCKEILEKEAKVFIRDSFERNIISKIALVHGGADCGDRDTIRHLSSERMMHDRKIRKQLLAALLRFSDEMADDSSRCDRAGLDNNTIPSNSVIYHRYSEALHTVKIRSSIENNCLELLLSFEINSDIASEQYEKNRCKVYLLDEIYERTFKMERERRYCMRYLRPYFLLDSIRVEIIIQNVNNDFQKESISYTLKETGYPERPRSTDPEEQIRQKSGREIDEFIRNEWGV